MDENNTKPLFRKPTTSSVKIFRGAYKYLQGESVYCEEAFEVYRDRKENNIYFLSQIHSRVNTGELLTVTVRYVVNKDYLPVFVVVARSLGKEACQEVYDFDQKSGKLKYLFANGEDQEEVEMPVPPKFSITTPSLCNSMLYLRSKKFDNTQKNFYALISSNNMWAFENPPYQQNIAVQRISTTTEKVLVEGKTLQAVQYKVFYDNEDDKNMKNAPTNRPDLRIFLSNHMTIPYLLKGDGMRVQIKYLNNLDDKD